jgi:hypothetical protein
VCKWLSLTRLDSIRGGPEGPARGVNLDQPPEHVGNSSNEFMSVGVRSDHSGLALI